MKTRLRSVAFVAAAGGMAVSSAAWAETLWPSQVSLIGVNVIPYDTTYGGTPVGGLSGLDYDTATGGYIAISDDRSQLAPARFYDMQIPVTSTTLGPVTFTGVTKFTDGSGATYAARTIDPESIRFSPSGGIVWSSEGDATLGINTSVRRATIAAR